MNQEPFLREMAERLEAERVEVQNEITRLTKPEEAVDNPSHEDLANDATEDLIEESLLKVHREILGRIEDAIGRIKDGTYGRCIECGAEIKPEDLRREPWIEYCEKCVHKPHYHG
jgi:DnaK suppressor protein